jgi:hypothetical protein
MSTRFWMMICFVLPGGIGAVLVFSAAAAGYFACAACGTHVQNEFHFLPAVQLSAFGELRELLPVGADHGPVLHALRA